MRNTNSAAPAAPSPHPNAPARTATLRFVAVIVGSCLLAVALLLMGVGLLLPNHWHVQRDVMVSAPPATILTLIEDFRQWESWAGRPMDDQTVRYSYSGPDSGVGARRQYSGEHAGAGYTEIVRSDPAYGVAMISAVGQEKPTASSRLEFKRQGGVTTVLWTDEGKIDSIFGVFLRANLEDELGSYMERSLVRLKTVAEQKAAVEAPRAPTLIP